MIELYSFIFLNFLAMISPGPDFAIVTQYGLSGSKKAALSATMGVVVALMIHVIYCVSGIALLLSSSKTALLTIQFAGGVYLGYLGLKSIKSALSRSLSYKQPRTKNAFFAGFLCNLLNPKAMVFFTEFIYAVRKFNEYLADESCLRLFNPYHGADLFFCTFVSNYPQKVFSLFS